MTQVAVRESTSQWAIQDSHNPKKPKENARSGKSGAESGAVGAESTLAEAILAVQRLPLSDEEKAAIVRRLMAEDGITDS